MNNTEKNMVEALIDLKEHHHVVGIKAEFETEGTRLEEALRLKEIVSKAGLDLTIKIGGCEAIKDIYDAKMIGVNTIVAPMIESAYAMQKFVLAINSIFSNDELEYIKTLINIETITGFSNLKNIITSSYFSKIDGIVLGRADMTGSMGLEREDINSNNLLEIANEISEEMQLLNKEMFVGGGVSTKSISFFKKMPYLTKFETRKVIFDAQNTLQDSNINISILKAINFELMWLQNKREFYGRIYKEDEARITMLEKVQKNMTQEINSIYV